MGVVQILSLGLTPLMRVVVLMRIGWRVGPADVEVIKGKEMPQSSTIQLHLDFRTFCPLALGFAGLAVALSTFF